MVGILSSVVRSITGERSARKKGQERPKPLQRKSWMQSLSNISQVFHQDEHGEHGQQRQDQSATSTVDTAGKRSRSKFLLRDGQ